MKVLDVAFILAVYNEQQVHSSSWVTYDVCVNRFDFIWCKLLGRQREGRTGLTFKVKNLVDIGLLRSRIRPVSGFDDIDIQVKHDADEYRAAWGKDP